MKLDLDARALRAFLDRCEDAEAVADGEYVVDLYDAETPVSLDLSLSGGACEALAARRLLFSEEEDGWYLGEEMDDAAAVSALLRAAMEGTN